MSPAGVEETVGESVNIGLGELEGMLKGTIDTICGPLGDRVLDGMADGIVVICIVHLLMLPEEGKGNVRMRV